MHNNGSCSIDIDGNSRNDDDNLENNGGYSMDNDKYSENDDR